MSKRFAPATERNREPIRDVLSQVLPESGRVLEIAAGTGEHAVFFAAAFPQLAWTPADLSADSLESIAAWRRDAGLDNLQEPVRLDASASEWPITDADALVCINMIHISPWEATVGLMRGAGRILPAGGVLYTYGPYRVKDRPTAPSNERFEQWLHGLDPSYGLRWVHDVEALAAEHGLALEQMVDMPANNLSLVFRKQ